MTRHLITLLLIVQALSMSSVLLAADAPAKEAAPPKTETDDNAALRYWQAIAQLPPLSDEETKLLSEGEASLADPKTNALLAKASTSLKLVTRASQLPRCSWGADILIDGPETLLPHLGKLRELTRILTLRSRQHFAQGRREEGVDDAITALRMARHSGTDPILISILVEYANESLTVDTLASVLPVLPAAHRQRLTAQLASVPPRHTIADGMAGERAFLVWIRRMMKENPRKLDQLMSAENVAEWVKLKLLPMEPLLKEVESMYDEVEKLSRLPASDFEKANADFEKKMKESKNPLVRMVVPGLSSSRRTEMRVEARMRLLRAAIVEAAGDEAGKAAAAMILAELNVERKPFDGGIDYVCTNLNDRDGKPVQLRVGKEKKAP